jgi:hypothetical protein
MHPSTGPQVEEVVYCQQSALPSDATATDKETANIKKNTDVKNNNAFPLIVSLFF